MRITAKAPLLRPGNWIADRIISRLFSGSGWSLVVWSGSQGIILLSSVIVARSLGAQEFGKFSLILNTLNSFSILGTFGVGLAATRHIAEFRSDRNETGRVVSAAQYLTVVFSITVATALILSAGWLATTVMNAPGLRAELQISSLLLLFTILINTQGGIFGGFEDFRLLALLTIGRSVITLALVLVGAISFGMRGAIAAMTGGAAIGWIMNEWALRRLCAKNGIPIPLWAGWHHIRSLVKFSFPAMLTSAIPGPSIWLSNSMLAHQPGGYAQVGIVNAAYQIRNILVLIPATVSSAVMPMVTSLHTAKDGRGVKRAFLSAVAMCAVSTGILLIPLLLLSTPLMAAFGVRFRTEGNVLRVMSLGGALLSMTVPVGNLIAGAGNIWLGVLVNVAWAVVLLGSGWYLVHQHATAMSLAQSHLIAYSLHLVACCLCAARVLRASISRNQKVEPEILVSV